MPSDETVLAVVQRDIDRMKDDVREIKETMNHRYVTQEEFRPVKVFTYGLIGIALTAVGVSVIGSVLK